jgi:hypothetical protein
MNIPNFILQLFDYRIKNQATTITYYQHKVAKMTTLLEDERWKTNTLAQILKVGVKNYVDVTKETLNMTNNSPQVKQEIERIENAFISGNISSKDAENKLTKNVGMTPLVAKRFIQRWAESTGRKSSTE